MGDAPIGTGTDIIVRQELEDLRSPIAVPDTKTKTQKHLEGQLYEHIGKLETLKANLVRTEGAIEVTEDKIKIIKERLEKLKTL